MDIFLQEGEQFSLEGPGLPGGTIGCRSGCLWITQAGDSRDFLLHSGRTLNLNGKGRVVLAALTEVRAEIVPNERVRLFMGPAKVLLCQG